MSEFWKDKKVVVTGGSGFIGTHFLNHLIEIGANVKTHVHKSPIHLKGDKLNVIHDIDLMRLDDCLKLT